MRLNMSTLTKGILVFILVVFHVKNGRAQAYEVLDNNKVLAIEELWLKKGINSTINAWQNGSENKFRIGQQFRIRYADQIQADQKEFFGFFKDPTVTAEDLSAPEIWLDAKQSTRLNSSHV